jgi:ABC-type sugar transport system substrate-binding protein
VSGFDAAFRALATGRAGFIPAPVIVMLLGLPRRTLRPQPHDLRRYVYAIGGNEEATRPVRRRDSLPQDDDLRRVGADERDCGDHPDRSASTRRSRLPGMMYELDAIAATGHRRHQPDGRRGVARRDAGRGADQGVLRNGLNLLGVSSFLQQIVIGGVIVVAVLLDTILKRRNRFDMKNALALILIAAASVSCNREAPADTRNSKPTVALVLKTLNHPFFVDMRRGAQEAADRLGVNLQVQAARAGDRRREADADRREPDQTGIQALAITPSGSREIVSALVKARDAKVPIIVVDTRVDEKAAADAGVHTETFVGSDNYEGGKLAGDYLLKVSGGKARVGILEGIPGHETGDSRLRGFRDAVKATPGVSIVASQPANWERDQGFNVFQNMLQAHPTSTACSRAAI